MFDLVVITYIYFSENENQSLLEVKELTAYKNFMLPLWRLLFHRQFDKLHPFLPKFLHFFISHVCNWWLLSVKYFLDGW